MAGSSRIRWILVAPLAETFWMAAKIVWDVGDRPFSDVEGFGVRQSINAIRSWVRSFEVSSPWVWK